ncbi:MAG: hypothetical protein U0521_02145 [Anaerolineae bacterium]
MATGNAGDADDVDELIWRYPFAGPFASLDDFVAHLRYLSSAGTACWMLFDQASGRAGWHRLFQQRPARPQNQSWGASATARLPSARGRTPEDLSHAAPAPSGMAIVGWNGNATRAQRALASLGAAHGISVRGDSGIPHDRQGCSRDTLWFRILDHEWDAVKRHLEEML